MQTKICKVPQRDGTSVWGTEDWSRGTHTRQVKYDSGLTFPYCRVNEIGAGATFAELSARYDTALRNKDQNAADLAMTNMKKVADGYSEAAFDELMADAGRRRASGVSDRADKLEYCAERLLSLI